MCGLRCYFHVEFVEKSLHKKALKINNDLFKMFYPPMMSVVPDIYYGLTLEFILFL